MKWHFLFLKNSEQDKNTLQATISVQWPEDDDLEKRKFVLPKILQTWASTLKKEPTDEVTCDVMHMSEDKTEAVVLIKPPPGAGRVLLFSHHCFGQCWLLVSLVSPFLKMCLRLWR